MYLLVVTRITSTTAKIESIINNIQDVPEEIIAQGIQVEEYPKGVNKVGKYETLYINPLTLEVYSEYEDRPLTQEEQLQVLKLAQDLMKVSLSDVEMAMAEMMGM